MRLIEKYGFFRLTLIPLGTIIIISAIINNLWGMGIVGAIVLVFGILNKCLLFGQCDIENRPSKTQNKK
ncbi:MAG: hypothetical protein IPI93_14405 [Sphingobacteriaceae bacterium]|nr:hypothetical protein [Sphingobacteriaceae bacterium]MBK7819053.1 hypothetical protein [Sphingobacteriaceae bacterium]